MCVYVHVLCISVFVQFECAYIKSPTVCTEPILSFSESLEKTALRANLSATPLHTSPLVKSLSFVTGA